MSTQPTPAQKPAFEQTVIKEFNFRTTSRLEKREENKKNPPSRPSTSQSLRSSKVLENLKSKHVLTTPRSPKLVSKTRSRKSLKENEDISLSNPTPRNKEVAKPLSSKTVEDSPKGAFDSEQALIKELIQIEHDHDLKTSFYPIDKNKVTTTFDRLVKAMSETTRCPQYAKVEITNEKAREILRAHRNVFAVEVETTRSGEKHSIVRVKQAGLSDGNIAKKPVWFIHE